MYLTVGSQLTGFQTLVPFDLVSATALPAIDLPTLAGAFSVIGATLRDSNRLLIAANASTPPLSTNPVSTIVAIDLQAHLPAGVLPLGAGRAWQLAVGPSPTGTSIYVVHPAPTTISRLAINLSSLEGTIQIPPAPPNAFGGATMAISAGGTELLVLRSGAPQNFFPATAGALHRFGTTTGTLLGSSALPSTFQWGPFVLASDTLRKACFITGPNSLVTVDTDSTGGVNPAVNLPIVSGIPTVIGNNG